MQRRWSDIYDIYKNHKNPLTFPKKLVIMTIISGIVIG